MSQPDYLIGEPQDLLDETQFWFDLLIRIGLVAEKGTELLQNEVEQLVKIFTPIKKKMEDRINKND